PLGGVVRHVSSLQFSIISDDGESIAHLDDAIKCVAKSNCSNLVTKVRKKLSALPLPCDAKLSAVDSSRVRRTESVVDQKERHICPRLSTMVGAATNFLLFGCELFMSSRMSERYL